MTEFATRCVHAGLSPDPSYGSVIPAIHASSTYVQPAPGEFVGDFDYSRSANPTRAALETALGELEGGLASAFSSGMAAEQLETLFGTRNERWLGMIEAMAADGGRGFVAVGAGHLVGKRGLVALLRKRGHTVVRIPGELTASER